MTTVKSSYAVGGQMFTDRRKRNAYQRSPRRVLRHQMLRVLKLRHLVLIPYFCEFLTNNWAFPSHFLTVESIVTQVMLPGKTEPILDFRITWNYRK